FCKTQLVELQQVAPALAVDGVALFAISYDSVEILRNFAATHGITYHLLSDEGSHAMRGLGLINDRVQEDHAVYGIKPNARHVNLPYPGVFVLDRPRLPRLRPAGRRRVHTAVDRDRRARRPRGGPSALAIAAAFHPAGLHRRAVGP